MTNLIPAHQLPIGTSARIAGYADNAAPFASRLMELGLVAGAKITLCRSAPLGDPLEFQVRGYHLALRKDEAACLKVMPL